MCRRDVDGTNVDDASLSLSKYVRKNGFGPQLISFHPISRKLYSELLDIGILVCVTTDKVKQDL